MVELIKKKQFCQLTKSEDIFQQISRTFITILLKIEIFLKILPLKSYKKACKFVTKKIKLRKYNYKCLKEYVHHNLQTFAYAIALLHSEFFLVRFVMNCFKYKCSNQIPITFEKIYSIMCL